MGVDDEDKPTVVLDLNALKKEKLKQEEDLANIAQELEFAVGAQDLIVDNKLTPKKIEQKNTHPEDFVESFLKQRNEEISRKFNIILFDFQSTQLQQMQEQFPKGFEYKIATDLKELNKFLAIKKFQILVFYYDVNPKAINQLCAQIKTKCPFIKTIILAKSISPKKAQIHAKTPYGANGYFQLPIHTKKMEEVFLKIFEDYNKN